MLFSPESYSFDNCKSGVAQSAKRLATCWTVRRSSSSGGGPEVQFKWWRDIPHLALGPTQPPVSFQRKAAGA